MRIGEAVFKGIVFTDIVDTVLIVVKSFSGEIAVMATPKEQPPRKLSGKRTEVIFKL